MIKRDILTGDEFTSEELEYLIKLSQILKSKGNFKPLKGKKMVLLFQKPSTRTRVSLEIAMYELGGYSIYMSQNETQWGRGESLADTAKVLSLYFDVVAARVINHKDLEELAKNSTIPVINAPSDKYHPLQMLGDLMTIKEIKGKIKGVKLVWIGDGNNVCNSLILGASKLGANIVISSPKGFEPAEEVIKKAKDYSKVSGGSINLIEEPTEAAKDADIIYTDSFISMGMEKEAERRLKIFLPKYQVNLNLLKLAKKDVGFLHCLPAFRGREVTNEVIDGNRSFVWKQAENRLHSFKALLCYLSLKKDKLDLLFKGFKDVL
ncbi:Ornithine carbamoyltransferase [archaeon HR06]|nr:Ornithine carbamoyltransferase [archaeon HR06]